MLKMLVMFNLLEVLRKEPPHHHMIPDMKPRHLSLGRHGRSLIGGCLSRLGVLGGVAVPCGSRLLFLSQKT